MLLPSLRHSLPALLLLAAPAFAEGPTEPRDRVIAGTWTVGRYYPIGFDQQVSLAFRQRIGDSEDILYKTRFWQVGAMGAWNPANWSARVEATVEPIAVFQLRVAYDTRSFFGGYGVLLSSADPNQAITDAAVAAATAADLDYPGAVHGITVEPALQAAFGPFVFRNTFGIEYNVWGVRAGDLYVYDPGPDILRSAQGWTLTETATFGYLGGNLFAGAQYIWINPVGVDGNQEHKVAALAAWTFFDRGAEHGLFNKPTIVALAIFNIIHRGRAGPFPTLVAGFSSESDLLGLFGGAAK
jgi:hypothetical protein